MKIVLYTLANSLVGVELCCMHASNTKLTGCWSCTIPLNSLFAAGYPCSRIRTRPSDREDCCGRNSTTGKGRMGLPIEPSPFPTVSKSKWAPLQMSTFHNSGDTSGGWETSWVFARFGRSLSNDDSSNTCPRLFARRSYTKKCQFRRGNVEKVRLWSKFCEIRNTKYYKSSMFPELTMTVRYNVKL